MDKSKIYEIINTRGNTESSLIGIMQDIQKEYGYLSRENLEIVANSIGVSISTVYSVATFYENFSLEPKGKHIIKLCDGTACHVKKSAPMYEKLRTYLGLKDKEKTTKDGLFTVETVACLGACGLAPTMTIDGEVHGKMDFEKVKEIVDNISKEDK